MISLPVWKLWGLQKPAARGWATSLSLKGRLVGVLALLAVPLPPLGSAAEVQAQHRQLKGILMWPCPSEALFPKVCSEAVTSCPGQGNLLGPCLKGHFLLWRAVPSHCPDSTAFCPPILGPPLSRLPLGRAPVGVKAVLGSTGFLPELCVESAFAPQKEDGAR